MALRQASHDEATRPHAARLDIFRIGAGIADMRIGQGDNLSGIGRVGENFLIAGHGGVEHHFTDSRASRSRSNTFKHRAPSEREHCSVHPASHITNFF